MPLKSFQDITRHCLDRGGDWHLLLIFLHMEELSEDSAQMAFGTGAAKAKRMTMLSKGVLEVNEELTFADLVFDADVQEPRWNAVAVLPVLYAATAEEVQARFAELGTNLRHNPQAVPLFNKSGTPFVVNRSQVGDPEHNTAH